MPIRDEDASRRRGTMPGSPPDVRDRARPEATTPGDRREPIQGDRRELERPATATGPASRGPANPEPPPDPRELAPTLSLPRGGGALKNIGDKFEANAFTGSGSLTIPIRTSPARDLTPTLALGYSTGSGNGPFGIGWALSVPQITRRTDRGLPLYDDARDGDVFILSGAEELVPLLEQVGDTWTPKVYTSGNFHVHAYRPRNEAGFARIERWVDSITGEAHWRTWTPDNVRSTYGLTAESRVADPTAPTRVFTWLLCETRDDRGNITVFQYKAEDLAGVDTDAPEEHDRLALVQLQSQRYLKRIYYGNAAMDTPGGWHFEVLFDYGEHAEYGAETSPWPTRPDTFSENRAGFDVRTRRLCRRILMLHHFAELEKLPIDPYLVSATELTYDENPVATRLIAVRHRGYVYNTTSQAYEHRAYPPVSFTYSAAEIDPTVRLLDPASLESLSGAIGGGRYHFVDLDGEGLPGFLTEQAGHWYYARNEGGAKFGPMRSLPSLPSTARLGGPQRLVDLDGDGQLSLASMGGIAPGFYDRAHEPCTQAAPDWRPFRSFLTFPAVDLDAPGVHLLDLNGDGFSDILVVEDDRFVWYPSRAKDGFGPPLALTRPRDERAGPRLLWSDPQQALYFSDMTGDGLADIVRIRNGEVAYWPSRGHGRFGRRIVMRGAPVFDRPDRFRVDRLRLGDTDGSGTTDIVYLRPDKAVLWVNQSGNSFGPPIALDGFPPVDTLSQVELVDLLGKGTAALVWSTDLPHRRGTHVAYMDLMSTGKPYLLTVVSNNMGLETRVRYAPSTQFYLADRAAGRPWKTRLPFPVHVVEHVETRDHVTGHTFVQKYRYHHGYFDGPEREFRGFGMVETEDTESWADYNAPKLFPTGHQIVDQALHSPPVLTKTWFHTGAYLGGTSLAHCYAAEYYSDKTQENPVGIAVDLADTIIPAELTPIEKREAVRALRGRALRVEVYGLDGSEAQAHPYSVAESNFAVRLLQPRAGQKHAAFFVHDREELSYHYERNPADPRVSHTAVLEVDDFGNPVRTVSVAYKKPLAVGVPDEQTKTSVVLTEADLVNVATDPNTYRLGVPVEARTYELTSLDGNPADPFTHAELLAHADAATELAYHGPPAPGAKRLLQRIQTYYYADDLASRLPLGQCGLRALPYETLTLAFTQTHLDIVFENGELTGLALDTEGGYRADGDRWWRPSGRVLFDAAHFYRVSEARDVFGHATTFTYDAHSLLLESATDALGNVVTAHNDYRVLAPDLVTDPNGNRQAAAFDALGMVVKTAVMGKVNDNDGDTLNNPTTELEYDLDVVPTVVHTIARENHGAGNTKFQHSYAYSGGLGQVVLQKTQAEPGLAPKRDGNGALVFDGGELVFQDTSPNLRWVGSGRVIVDNKGNPIKQYEPFFDSSPAYTDEAELVEFGVTPLLHYDPLGRMIRTDMPDGTYATVAFTPWQQVARDANDNVLGSDWYADRQALSPGTPHNDGEIEAADKAALHADTPTTTLLDPLGRAFRVIAHNGFDPNNNNIPILFTTSSKLDIEGNTLEVKDARNNTAEINKFAAGGLKLETSSVDAGTRQALPDAQGRPLRAWDSRQNVRRWTYDALSRPTHAYLKHDTDDEKLQQRIVYGESLGAGADATNHRGRVYRVYDSAGVLTSAEYDFKGNRLATERRLAEDYKVTPDWIALATETDPATIHTVAAALLESETFTTSWTYDALNRVRTQTTPDDSVTTQTFGDGGMLQSVAVNIRGAVTATDIVTNIDYNARGQRTVIEYGNGSTTDYEYDPRSFRVTRIHTERPNNDPSQRKVQDLRYHYDPSGNIAQIRDEAQQGVFFANAYVDATQSFKYDPTYRLTEATGREHAQLSMPTPEGFVQIAHPQQGSDAQQRYTQFYAYDAVGNITRMRHQHGQMIAWERRYLYATDGNRLEHTNLPDDDVNDPPTYTGHYTYDAHGNMTLIAQIPGGLTWDDDDRLQSSGHLGGGTVYYVYDGAGQRVRKVTVNQSGTTSKQRLYFGSWETYREHKNINTTNDLDLERETLHVHDDHGRVCLIETKTVEDEDPIAAPANVARYQYSNHLGTANLELDGNAEVISYEEFHPYGTSSYRAANGAIEVSAKRFRYTGQERDEETGLTYHGARYYASWLGRWTAADPIGLAGGIARFSYSDDNPVRLNDPQGTLAQEPDDESHLPHPEGTPIRDPKWISARVKVTPGVALEVLKNISEGKQPWRPELGRVGSAAWFITEGDPHAGTSPDATVEFEVKFNVSDAVEVTSAQLSKMHQEILNDPNFLKHTEKAYRERHNIAPDAKLSKEKSEKLARYQRTYSERLMWQRVAEMARESAGQAAEVVLENSEFSKTKDGGFRNGRFAVTSDAARIVVNPASLLEGMKKAGLSADSITQRAAELAYDAGVNEGRLEAAARVRAVFRVAGKVFLIAGAATDSYRLYHAEEKGRVAAQIAGGWAGAATYAGLVGKLFAPADSAGPLAWALHGTAVLAAGAYGYWAGSRVGDYAYSLAVRNP